MHLYQNGPWREKIMKAGKVVERGSSLKTCLSLLFQITASIPLPSPLLPHSQIPGKSRWRTKHNLVNRKFIQTLHNLPPKQYTSQMTKRDASRSLPHGFPYENKCFLHGKITKWGFDGKLNHRDNPVRDKWGCKIKRLNSACQEKGERNGKRQQENSGGDLDPAMPEHLQREKLIPGFQRASAPPPCTHSFQGFPNLVAAAFTA